MTTGTYKFNLCRLKKLKVGYVCLFVFVVANLACHGQQLISDPSAFVFTPKPGYQGMPENKVMEYLAKIPLENFRLTDQRVTLSFDNGFDITLLSATELLQAGKLNGLSGYQKAFPPGFKLPSFHINDLGQVAAGYPVNTSTKYAGNRY